MTAPVRQMKFIAHLDISKLAKDARGYTTLVFVKTKESIDKSIDLCIKMEPEVGDLYDILNNGIRCGELNTNSRVTITVDQYPTNCFVDIEIINFHYNDNTCHSIQGFAAVSLYYPEPETKRTA